MSWSIQVDDVLCQGHGVCESEAPEVFSVSKAGQLTILDRSPGDDRRPGVELAVRYCPTHALTIVEKPSRTIDTAATEPSDNNRGT